MKKCTETTFIQLLFKNGKLSIETLMENFQSRKFRGNSVGQIKFFGLLDLSANASIENNPTCRKQLIGIFMDVAVQPVVLAKRNQYHMKTRVKAFL